MSSIHSSGSTPRQAHLKVVGRSLLVVIAMFGFGYAMVPLYDIVCEITGLNGKTGRVSSAAAEAVAVDEQREIVVEFVASVNQSGGFWEFHPTVAQMTVQPGKTYETSYHAENLSTYAVTGQATPSVSPFAAAPYFNKTECFCFTRQTFTAGEARDMPLTFIVDPELPPNVDRITLSYTLFKAPDQST